MKTNRYFLDGKFFGNRLDVAIASIAKESRSKITKLIRSGNVLVNGKVVQSADFLLKTNSSVCVSYQTDASDCIPTKSVIFEVIFEDNDIVLINKPAGLVVHPGVGHIHDTLVNGLMYRYETLEKNNFRAGIVHRIDKDTSGILVVAKNDYSHLHIANQVKNRSMQRVYYALVWGVPMPLQGSIEFYIGKSRHDHTKMAVYKDKSKGKYALTYYKVVSMSPCKTLSMVECRLATGRTHQIRVHMAYIGHAIVGDFVYGSILYGKNLCKIEKNKLTNISLIKRQCLHAHHITLKHPNTNKVCTFVAPIPHDMLQICEDFGIDTTPVTMAKNYY
ncbi:RluA family pseudouridine synthase [Candidatus Sneabacter namystus]|uniref:Pseudouridine synthase n=1 Tax=Candidatus Sneabacter namystus TaxID=2601646 RepID=A0A5C0UJN4_9RICK|nr:RluA family pseudouridine synthase [Candidatus Sneabacter namystus]QEK39692.1 RluA family pseudouridine synthase [Candidatus Sneabacter namystus]